MAQTYFISPSNAKELQAKSCQAKIAARLAREAARQIDAQDLQPQAAPLPSEENSFQMAMLVNVRAQIRSILARVDKELERSKLDTRALKELGETLARFEAMEQKLSMRAGPGSYKPTAPPRKNQRSQPADFEPLPTARSSSNPRPGPVEPAPDLEPEPRPASPPIFTPTDFSKLE